ncbi:MAG: PaaI family thioesterase [Bacteroidales bacterium]|nr:PaaI family thioesterase [Bacteroidales bacterium]
MNHDHTGNKIINPYTKLKGYNCFGCAPHNSFGLKMSFIDQGEFVICYWSPSDHFSGYRNVLHGGIQATLLDEIASWTIQVKLKTAGVTANIDLRYKKPVFVDQGQVLLRAKIREIVKRIAVVETELFNPEGELCCSGIVKYLIYPLEVAREKLNFPEFDAFFNSK